MAGDSPEEISAEAAPRSGAAALGGIIGWALALPFFLLPGPLTIEAQDIYGGFSVHVRIGLWLALIGALTGGFRLAREHVGDRAPGSVLRVAGAGLSGLLLAGLAWGLVFVSGLGGEYASSVLEGLPGFGLSRGDFWDPSVPYRACAAALLVRGGLDRREGGLARLLAAAAGIALTTGVLQCLALSQDPTLASSAELPTAGAFLALAALWSLLPRLPWLPRWLPALLAALPFAALGALLGLQNTVGGSGEGPDPSRLRLVFGAVSLGLGVGAVAVQGLWLAGQSATHERATLPRTGAVLGHIVLAGILVIAGREAMAFAGYLAESWASIFRPIASTAAQVLEPSPVPPQVTLAWLLAVVPGGLLARSGTAIRRWLGSLSVAWVLLVTWRGIAILGDTGLGAGWHLPALACLALGLSWPWLLRTEHRAGQLSAWGLVAGAVVVGPVAAVYLAAALVLIQLPAGLLVLLGAVLAGLAAAGTLRAELPEQIGIVLKLAILALLGVARVVPIHVGISLGLFPAFTVGVALLLTVLVAALVFRRPELRRRGPAVALVALWLLFYACFGAVTWYKAGPSAARCADVLEESSGLVLLDRFSEGGEYLDVEPYDVLPLAEPGGLLVSFKRIDRHGGFLEVLDLDAPTERTRLRTRKPAAQGRPESPQADEEDERDDPEPREARRRDERRPSTEGAGSFWPERLEADPRNGNVYVQLLGTEDYAIWELRVERPAEGGPPSARVERRLRIRWEPGNPAVDASRGKLVLSYVPNREADNPLLEAIDLETFEAVGGTPKPAPRLEMADYAAADPHTGRYYVPAFYDNARFALAEIDGDSLRIRRQRETYFATVGIAADGASDRLYLTNVMAGGLFVLAQGDLSTQQVLPAGRFPRDLVLDRGRQRLYVAGYGDGIVRAYSTEQPELEPLHEVSVGPLLRGVGLDPRSGRVYAASACGVFEVAGLDGAAPGAAAATTPQTDSAR